MKVEKCFETADEKIYEGRGQPSRWDLFWPVLCYAIKTLFMKERPNVCQITYAKINHTDADPMRGRGCGFEVAMFGYATGNPMKLYVLQRELARRQEASLRSANLLPDGVSLVPDQGSGEVPPEVREMLESFLKAMDENKPKVH